MARGPRLRPPWEFLVTRHVFRRARAAAQTIVLLAAGVILAGCGVDFAYLIPAATGQIDIILRAVPIDDAIASGTLDAETVSRLRLVQDVRVYARDVIGLNAGEHYTTFYDAGDEAVAYNLSASRKDRFEPFVWTFPFVGTVPYLGFFDREAALARRDELVAANYDVYLYEIDAYYALGVFPNPVLSPMLKRPESSLIDTVIHELVHATIIRQDDTPFNESLATYIGRTGAAEYLDDRFADQPERRAQAIARFEDADRFSAFMLGLYNDLAAFYASDLPAEAKIAGRADVFQAGRTRFVADVLPLMNLPENYAWVENLPANNAYMLGVRRYNLELDAFDAVYQATGRNWPQALAVYRAAAQADDSYAYLRDWVAGDAKRAAPAGTAEDSGDSAEDASAPCALHRATTWVPQR